MQAEAKQGNGSTFRRNLLNRLQQEFKNREEMRERSLQEWVCYVTFICNIFDYLKVSHLSFLVEIFQTLSPSHILSKSSAEQHHFILWIRANEKQCFLLTVTFRIYLVNHSLSICLRRCCVNVKSCLCCVAMAVKFVSVQVNMQWWENDRGDVWLQFFTFIIGWPRFCCRSCGDALCLVLHIFRADLHTYVLTCR